MAVFGKLLYLPYASGTIVFISVLVVFTVFEGLLHILEVECNRRGLKGLVKKMYREFMIMGFISFAIFLASELSTFQTDIWYDAFKFAHIELLFIGFVFVIQSGLLTTLVSSRRKTLLAHDSSPSETLIVDYVQLHSAGGLTKFLFEHGPISIPIPPLRERIEYKIIQEFFIRNYNLPPEFKFANYMCRVLRDYLISLVEVRPISWVIMASLVTINLVRIRVLDPILSRDVCQRYPAKNLHRSSGSSRRLLRFVWSAVSGAPGDGGDGGGVFPAAGGTDDHHDDDRHLSADEAYGQHVCQEYLLRVTLMCLFFIVLYLLGVLVASEVYIQRLVDKVLDQEETIEWLEDEEQRQIMMAMDNGMVDISQLPDDTHTNAAPAPSAGKKDDEDGDAGIEMRKRGTDSTVSGTAGTDASTAAPLPAPTPAAALGPRRLSAAYRMPSSRTRSGSVEEMLQTGELPPPPVHGAAAVRRLSINHRMGSARDGDLASLIAAGTGVPAAGTGTDAAAAAARRPPLSPAAPQATAARRGMTAAYRAGSAGSITYDTGRQPSISRTGSSENIVLDANPLANARRMVLAHRAGSLRSEGGAADDSTPSVGSPGQRKGFSFLPRTGSVRSMYSEKSEQFGTPMNVVNTSHNRRFLYLRCLERIMHQEFAFHANEAKRLRQEGVSGSTVNETHSAAAGTPLRARTNTHHGLPRTQSVSSMQEGGAGEPLVHGDMRSNFQMMQTLRKEMLLENQSIAEANGQGLQRHASFLTSAMGLFGPSSHGTKDQQPYSPAGTAASSDGRKRGLSEAAQLALRPISARVPMQTPSPATQTGETINFARSKGDRGSANSLVTTDTADMTKSATSESRQSPLPPSAAHHTEREVEPRSGAMSLQERYSAEHSDHSDDDHHRHSGNRGDLDSGAPRGRRQRTFSLAFEAPPLVKAPSSATDKAKKKKKVISLWIQVKAVASALTVRVWSAIMGHHLGQAEAVLDADIADMQRDFAQIFAWNNAELYYFVVEFSLLVQCVYLAFWATNFVFIALDSYYPVLWSIALVVPIPLNFLITKQIIFTSVMLKSIVTLDKRVADEICEDAVNERNVKHRVRKVIRTALRTMEISKENWEQYMQDQFELFIPDHETGLSQTTLRLFLHSMQIFLTDATVDKIFQVLDVDQNGIIEWEEVFPIIFPELVRKQVKINRHNVRASKDSNAKQVSFDLQIQGELKSSREKKEEGRKERKNRRRSMLTAADDVAVDSDAELVGDGVNGGDKNDKHPHRARFAEDETGTAASSLGGSGRNQGSENTSTDATPRSPRPRATQSKPPALPAAAASLLGDGGDGDDVRSDGSERGDESSESSFNSHSLSSGHSSDEGPVYPTGRESRVYRTLSALGAWNAANAAAAGKNGSRPASPHPSPLRSPPPTASPAQTAAAAPPAATGSDAEPTASSSRHSAFMFDV